MRKKFNKLNLEYRKCTMPKTATKKKRNLQERSLEKQGKDVLDPKPKALSRKAEKSEKTTCRLAEQNLNVQQFFQ